MPASPQREARTSGTVPGTFRLVLASRCGLAGIFSKRSYQPFVVELVGGTRLVIDNPDAIGFGAGNAGYIGAERELSLFDHDEVSQITILPDKAASD